MEEQRKVLPPGFHFNPTDEQLIVYFLCRRASSMPLPCNNIIPDIDINNCDPWELKEKALSGQSGLYFFSRLKQNRSTKKGFWKDLGFNEPIFTSSGNEVGIKHYLVFCADGEIGSVIRTNWFMDEFHIIDNKENLVHDIDEWVLCRVHEENSTDDFREGSNDRYYCHSSIDDVDDGIELSYMDEIFFSMDDDDQEDITYPS